MQLDLVGLRIDLRESDQQTIDLVSREWPEFVAPEGAQGPADLTLRARVDPSVVGPLEEIDQRAQQDVAADAWTFAYPELDGRLELRAGAGDLRYRGRVALLNYLRLSLSVLLRAHGGALFHAASVHVAGGVLLFPGVSGTGKSTIAGLAAPRPVLSDEITGLRLWHGRVHAFPTPFWGDLPRVRAAGEGPLKAIVLLSRAEVTSLSAATSGEAVAALLEGANLFEAAMSLSPEVKRAFVASVGALACVPCSRLSFRLPSNPWPLLDPKPLD